MVRGSTSPGTRVVQAWVGDVEAGGWDQTHLNDLQLQSLTLTQTDGLILCWGSPLTLISFLESPIRPQLTVHLRESEAGLKSTGERITPSIGQAKRRVVRCHDDHNLPNLNINPYYLHRGLGFQNGSTTTRT